MMENQEVARKFLEEIAKLIKAAEQLWRFGASEDYVSFEKQAADMQSTLQNMVLIHENEASLKTIADSLRRIMLFAKERSHKTLHKIEFELLPFLKESYQGYFFYSCVFPEKNLMEEYYQHKMVELGANPYIDEAVKTGRYKYDLSIGVLAFNKLEYTKMCVESLLSHIPQDLNYELILLNHGSTDGTKEFFESIAPTKQLDLLINGSGVGAFTRIIEGKYYLEVSNDVIVTENAIANMIRCMDSDDKIAWVVPTTPNVSNFPDNPCRI